MTPLSRSELDALQAVVAWETERPYLINRHTLAELLRGYEEAERLREALNAKLAYERSLPDLMRSSGFENGLMFALAAIDAQSDAGRECGCTADTELGASPVCPVCGHRDHGRSGCRAIDAQPDAGEE